MMFFDYLSYLDLSKFSNIFVIIKYYDANDDVFDNLVSLASIYTLKADLLFDLHELFNNFNYFSISHLITDHGESLVLKVVVYE